MKKNVKVIAVFLAVFLFSFASREVIYAKTLIGATPQVATQLITSENNQLKTEQVTSFVEKIEPFITYDGGKTILTSHNPEEIGISQEELNDFERGLQSVSFSSSSKLVNNDSTTNVLSKYTVQPNVTVPAYDDGGYDSAGVYITLSPTTVRTILTIALIAGVAVGFAAAIMGQGSVIIIGGFMCYSGHLTTAIAAAITALSGIISIWWTGGPVHITIPRAVVSALHGVIYVNTDSYNFSLNM